ncbi:MAG: M20 family metallopeptidase [Candidatus Heimdallarchaeaceae archaeon]
MSEKLPEKKITPKIPLSSKEKKILALVDEQEEEIVELLQQLVRISSVNYSESIFTERNEIFLFTKEYMEKQGFETSLYKAPFPSKKKNEFYYNLISSYLGEPTGKTLQFNGHLDIVPFNEENWDPETPPLSAVIKEGKIYGRGTIDMKAGVACQMIAMKILKESKAKIRGKLQLWLTPDEETHGKFGSIFMTSNHLDVVKADATIVSEATTMRNTISPTIVFGEKGPHWLKLTFHGVAGHGSWPKVKSNALNKAARFIYYANKKLKFPKVKPPISRLQLFKMLLSKYKLKDLKKLRNNTEEKNPLDKDKRNTKIVNQTTFSFNKIQAGLKTNIIPDTCELEIDFRVMPGISTQEFFNSLVKFCSKLKYKVELPEGYQNVQDFMPKFKNEPTDISVAIITIGEGSVIDPNTEFGKILQNTYETIYNSKPIFGFNTGFTDAGNMREAGLENTFIIGPRGGNAHNANEYVEIDSLKEITKFYLLLAYRYLK